MEVKGKARPGKGVTFLKSPEYLIHTNPPPTVSIDQELPTAQPIRRVQRVRGDRFAPSIVGKYRHRGSFRARFLSVVYIYLLLRMLY